MRKGTELLEKVLKPGALPTRYRTSVCQFSASATDGGEKSSAKLQGGDATLDEYLDVIVCPLTKEPLKMFQDGKELLSESIGAAFPVKDGTPCLVPLLGRIVSAEPDESS